MSAKADKNKELTLSQKKFADHFIEFGSAGKAYFHAYPHTKDANTANTLGYKLANKVYVKEYIRKVKEQVESLALEDAKEDAKELKLKFLTAAKKRSILQKIATGKAMINDIVVFKGDPIEVSRKPNFLEMLKAVDIDNKMSGDEAPKKSALTDTNGNIIESGNSIIFKLDIKSSL